MELLIFDIMDFDYLGHTNISWKVFICLSFILQLGRIIRSKVRNVTGLHRNSNLGHVIQMQQTLLYPYSLMLHTKFGYDWP